MKEKEINGKRVAVFEDDEVVDIGCYKIVESEFLGSDKINFSCVYKYSNIVSPKPGRGDNLEGLFARLHKKNNINDIKRYRMIYGMELIEKEKGDYIEFKRVTSQLVPIYCFYAKGVKVSDFANNVDVPYEAKSKYLLESSLFKDFGDNIDNISMVVFKSQKSLKNAVIEALDREIPKSIENINVFSGMVKYEIPEFGYWECNEYRADQYNKIPYELFYKRKILDYQSEGRIAVHLDNKLLDLSDLNYLLKIDNSVISKRVAHIPTSGIEVIHTQEVLGKE